MELPEKLFEIIYNILVQQNEMLFKEIATRERIPYIDLCRRYIPSRKQFRHFMRHLPLPPSLDHKSSECSAEPTAKGDCVPLQPDNSLVCPG